MQLPLLLPGTTITSRITGARIIISRTTGNLIIGKLEGFKRYPPSHPLRVYDGTKIIHKKNIIWAENHQ
jgi:hypothetical protein